MKTIMKSVLLSSIMTFCCACNVYTEYYERATINTDKFVVIGVEKVNPCATQPKQYRVMIDARLTTMGTSVCFYTNTLHHVGDTLCINKLN